MELYRFFRFAIEKMCKKKKSLNHLIEKKNRNINQIKFHYGEMQIFKLRDVALLSVAHTTGAGAE